MGSLYAALAYGRLDETGLRTLLACHPLADERPVYAVDCSVWPRRDAETSPERGFYYPPSRPAAGQPIVAGWSYMPARIVLAAPFWDRATALQLSELLERRLTAGVCVDILTRSAAKTGDGYAVLASRLGSHPQLRLYRWYERNSADMFGAQTFHFKAVVIDDGARAYLGSANMTAGGLRSRMELGTELQGEGARTLARVLDVVLAILRPARG